MATSVPPTPTPGPEIVKATAKEKKPKKAKTNAAAPVKCCSSGYPKDVALPEPFVDAVRAVEEILKTPAWLLIQDPHSDHVSPPPCHSLDDSVLRVFLNSKEALPKGKPIPLIIDSPGGQAKSAFRIASFLRDSLWRLCCYRSRIRQECRYAVSSWSRADHFVHASRAWSFRCADVRS